jgi:hypothetical protein
MTSAAVRQRPPRHVVAARRQLVRRRRRRTLIHLGLVAIIVFAGAAIWGGTSDLGTHKSTPNGKEFSITHGKEVFVPTYAHLSAIRARMLTLSEGQLGYTTAPANTYCNKFSAYWYSGTADCGNSSLDEEWCADFVAWVWQKAGVRLAYQYINGDLNSSSASFYEWGVAHGTWHPVGSGYIPQPGDAAVYGLNTQTLVATHVAMVLAYAKGARGPIDINGDGDLTGFSRVEIQANEYFADAGSHGSRLSGYVTPN